MTAAMIMCTDCSVVEGLNIAAHGSLFTIWPSRISKPVGEFIHPLAATTKNAPATPYADRQAGQHMDPRRQPVPPVQVHPEEDHLDEERERFQREREPVDLPEPLHQSGPEHSHLERQDRARHRTQREQHTQRMAEWITGHDLVVDGGVSVHPAW